MTKIDREGLGPDERTVANALIARFMDRGKARGNSYVTVAGNDMRPYKADVDDWPPSYRDDFIADAKAVLEALSRTSPVGGWEPAAARPLAEWAESDGNVLWWAMGSDGKWLGEPPYVGSPLDLGQTVEVEIRTNTGEFIHQHMVGGWPGYHTHWTPLPASPAQPGGEG
jgi:hypothetical protein